MHSDALYKALQTYTQEGKMKGSPNLKRPRQIPLMVADEEKLELQRAADRMGVALSVFIRVHALEAARRRETKAA